MYYLVKEDYLKRLHTVWFHLYDILEKAKILVVARVGGYSG